MNRNNIWTKYVIIVPTHRDKCELMEAFRHIHDSDCDPRFNVVNQLMHEYLEGEDRDGKSNNIIVNKELYENIKR